MATLTNEAFVELKTEHDNLKNRVDKLEDGFLPVREDIREIKTELRWIKWLLTVPLVQLAITVFQLLSGN